MNDDENGVHPSQQIECYNREQRVWDKILNDSYKAMMDGLEPEQQQKLRAMQRTWIQTRDLTCAFYYDYFRGSMANPMMASCDNRETARRAIYLRIFAQRYVAREMMIADDKNAAPGAIRARRSSRCVALRDRD